MCTGKILAIIKEGKSVTSLDSGEEGGVILDKTCFYAEQGGQIYDTGVLAKIGDSVKFKLYRFVLIFLFLEQLL